jgi:6-pyruvoyltetrahydropterin/6-carboxytetrahydropterin synthase
VPFLKGKMASAEILAEEIWKLLKNKIPEITATGHLYSIKLYETPRNFVEYFGPDQSNP